VIRRGVALLLAVALVAGCGKEQSGRKRIGFSQANLGEPWRVAMNADIAEAATAHPELEFVYADAQQDNAKQVADVENFLRQKIDLLIISPNEAKPLTAVVKRTFESKIPVIVLDRNIEGDTYTTFIGADNRAIGRAAGEVTAKLLNSNGDISHLETRIPEELARQRNLVSSGSIDLSRVELGDKSFLLSTHVVADMRMSTYHWEATYTECKLFSVNVTIGPATGVDPADGGSGPGSGPPTP